LVSELYNKTEVYLTQTLGEHFIIFTLLLTTAVTLAYLLVMHYMITHLDAKYFLKNSPHAAAPSEKRVRNINSKFHLFTRATHTTFGYFIYALKILLGICLLGVGIAMLVLPGQGILTIVLGLSLLPFPGKHALEKNLLARKSVRASLNWFRKKANKPPFIFESDPHEPQ
jgi:hypothetical protein